MGKREAKDLGVKWVIFYFEMAYDITGLAGIAELLCCCKLKWF